MSHTEKFIHRERVDFYPNKDSHVHKYYDLITGRNFLNLKVSGKEIVLTFVNYLYAKKRTKQCSSEISLFTHLFLFIIISKIKFI